MSATRYGNLDLQGQSAWIDRAQAQTRKFVPERLKPASEAGTLRRDRSFYAREYGCGGVWRDRHCSADRPVTLRFTAMAPMGQA